MTVSDISFKLEHRTMIVGVQGQGKSVCFKAIVKSYLQKGIRVFLYDTEHEYGHLTHPYLTLYQPKHAQDIALESHITEFNAICNRIFSLGNIVFAVESIDVFCPSEKKGIPVNYWKIVNWGRKRFIGLILTSRSPMEVNKKACRGQNHWFVYHLYGEGDLRWLRSFLSRQDIKRLPTLKNYNFIYWNTGMSEGEINDPIDFNDTYF